MADRWERLAVKESDTAYSSKGGSEIDLPANKMEINHLLDRVSDIDILLTHQETGGREGGIYFALDRGPWGVTHCTSSGRGIAPSDR